MKISHLDIELKQAFNSKEDAIRYAGQKLFDRGYVNESYIESMIIRDSHASTYIGNGVAIPHGTDEARDLIINSGIVVIQVPDGIEYNGEVAYVIFGIAGKNNKHMDLLSQIALICSDKENVRKLSEANTKYEIQSILCREQS